MNGNSYLDRTASLKRIVERDEAWDIAVIGGGATGVGIAVDAASRGFRPSCVFSPRGDAGRQPFLGLQGARSTIFAARVGYQPT